MREINTSLYQGSHVFHLDQFFETAIIIAFEFTKAHCKSRLVFQLNLYHSLFYSGTIDQTAFGVVPEKFSFKEFNNK
jgi:hypothetical protein